MNRKQLATLREAAQEPGNGHDPHPPPIAPISRPRPAKARQNKVSTRTAELRLTEALCDSSGMSVSALARATSANRATTRERLQQLAARGTVEKDAEGLWRLKGDEARPAETSRADARPIQAPSS
jgi:hypothetical protein